MFSLVLDQGSLCGFEFFCFWGCEILQKYKKKIKNWSCELFKGFLEIKF
jgi:hypothetical protein